MSFTKKFQTEFERLNPQQKEAVEAIEGPLLVVAGPGTGKTQTLALRLANILKKTQAKPHNLLALTFTEAAAINLKKRLAGIIGSEAYGIMATTFHAFCSRIHSTFPSEFASTRERIQIDELRQSQLFREILAQGGADRFELLAPLRAPDLYLRDLSRAVSDLKREGISPDRLREILKGEEEELAREERINPRTQKPLGRILTREKQLAKNFELATFYENYQKQMEEKGFTDFDDLILSVVEKLNSKEDFLLAYLQENFLYTLVDEFQDTNGSQNAILRAWGSFDTKPNLCVVGDDDQSIFRFQGASLENILDFHKNYPEAQIVTLTQNYRSTPEVIATAESLIERNSERLVNKLVGLEKILQAVAKSEGRKPQIVEAGSEADEATFIVAEIEKLVNEKTPPEEIAVIYRNRKHADVLAGALGRKQLPFFRADGQNALSDSRVQQLLKLLRVVENPRDALSSLAVFFADFAEIPEVEVYRLAKEVSGREAFLDVGLDSKEKSVKVFVTKLLSFQKMKAEQNLLELAENVAAESGLTRKIAGNKEYESAEAVHAFLAFVRNFAITREDASLKVLLEDLRAMEQQGVKLPIPSRAHAAVTLTTAHSAKGLEWEHVFLIHADDNAWGGRAKREMIKLQGIGDRVQGIDDPSTSSGRPADEKTKRIEDERRLFFVALTRAKRNLTISFAREYDFRKSVESRFIAEIEPNLVQRIEAPKADFAILPMEGEQRFSPETEKFLRSLLENFKLSPTALNNYLSCPQKFLFQNLLRIPTKTEVTDRLGMIFGNAMHAAFEEFFREFKKTGTMPENAVAITALRRNLDREPLTAAQRKNVERDAVSALEKYLAFHAASFAPPVDVEYNFGKHDVHLDDVQLTGKVDRIDFIHQTKADVSFVDYKSMKPFSRAAIQGETANSTGDSYRQLLFYMLLAELDSRFIFQPKEAVLSFVRENEKSEFINESFVPKKEEVEELKKTIREVWVKMQKLEFGCEEGECRKCDFGGICGK